MPKLQTLDLDMDGDGIREGGTLYAGFFSRAKLKDVVRLCAKVEVPDNADAISLGVAMAEAAVETYEKHKAVRTVIFKIWEGRVQAIFSPLEKTSIVEKIRK